MDDEHPIDIRRVEIKVRIFQTENQETHSPRGVPLSCRVSRRSAAVAQRVRERPPAKGIRFRSLQGCGKNRTMRHCVAVPKVLFFVMLSGTKHLNARKRLRFFTPFRMGIMFRMCCCFIVETMINTIENICNGVWLRVRGVVDIDV